MSRLPALDLADPILAARLPGQSLAISAGAGSGKTFTLVSWCWASLVVMEPVRTR